MLPALIFGHLLLFIRDHHCFPKVDWESDRLANCPCGQRMLSITTISPSQSSMTTYRLLAQEKIPLLSRQPFFIDEFLKNIWLWLYTPPLQPLTPWCLKLQTNPPFIKDEHDPWAIHESPQTLWNITTWSPDHVLVILMALFWAKSTTPVVIHQFQGMS